MGTTIINKILSFLEDAVEEQDWKRVNEAISELETLYERLDREESGQFGYDD